MRGGADNPYPAVHGLPVCAAGHGVRTHQQGLAVETRYAMVRWAVLCLTLILLGISSEDNPADMLTKCLPLAAFLKHRAVLLGTALPPQGR